MKNLSLFIFIISTITFFSCNNTDKAETVAGSEVLSVADFELKAGNFVGKTVEVSGIVDHVCKHGGKKILLVSDNSSLHIYSDSRFDDKLTGEELIFTGVVEELVIDEAYCQKLENDDIKVHGEGEDREKILESRKMQAREFRDSMKTAGVDELKFYSMKYVSHKKKVE